MTDSYRVRGMGWLPDYPDCRDYHVQSDRLATARKALKLNKAAVKAGPASVDLRQWCSPIEDQQDIGSCTANATVGMVEYFERRAFGKHLDASRLFLYKATRNLLHWKRDTGAFLRSTMAALTIFGVPPEEYWPYVPDNFDDEPPAFCYSFAQSYQAIEYVRLDPQGTPNDQLLASIKSYLAAGLPSVFGFTVYSSIDDAAGNGKIPFPGSGEQVVGGHAVMAVGCDDKMKIGNANGPKTTGAMLIRNSWGTGWGDNGYGWLPYEYVLQGIADDWWTLIKAEWINTENFGLSQDTKGGKA